MIARVLGLLCGEATIMPNYSEGSAGYAIIKDPWETAAVWDAAMFGRLSGPYRDANMAFRARAIAGMAGAEAEIALIGHSPGGDDDDRYWISVALGEIRIPDRSDDGLRAYERRLRSRTRGLVRRHRDKIERVASDLIERKALTGEEIDALVSCGRDQEGNP